ncbi:MAG TPA: glycosyltransferase family 39 protein [Candidatus Dormibacteraeota bacterium]|nr:glycosyltransferase family 39 protein [Candidatus Dormibacteraeota bacterium]
MLGRSSVLAPGAETEHPPAAGPAGAPPRRGRDVRILLPAAVACAAAVPYLVDISGKSIWYDEGITAGIARMGPAKLAHTLWWDEPNMSLYYVLMRLWSLGQGSELLLRLPSVVAGVAAAALVCRLALRMFGTQVAVVASIFTLTDAFYIQYAQEARSYMLTILLVTVSSFLFVRCVEEEGARLLWVAYAVVTALAVYAHFFAAAVPIAHALSLPLLGWRRIPWRRAIPAFAFAAALTAPIVYTELRGFNRPLVPTFTAGVGGLSESDITSAFASLAGGGGKLLAVAVALAAMSAGWLAFVAVARPTPAIERWRLGFAVLCFGVPLALIVVASVVNAVIQSRYLAVSGPGLALCVGVGIGRLPDRRAVAGATAVLVALAAVGIQRWYGDPTKEDFRGAVDYVLAHGRPGDAVMLLDPERIVMYEYYAGTAGDASAPTVAYPPEGFDPFPQRHDGGLVIGAATGARIAATSRRVWVVLPQDTQSWQDLAELDEGLQRQDVLVDHQDWFRVSVELYAGSAAR